jgi:hypothetical protein
MSGIPGQVGSPGKRRLLCLPVEDAIEFIEQEITEQLVVSIAPTGFGVIERMDEQISPHHGVDNSLNVSHRLVFQIAGGHFRIDGFKDRRSNQKVPGGLIQTGKTASEK